MIPGEAAGAALAMLGFGGIIYGPWQSACMEWSRQTMFMQRDKLFELARAGRVSFQDPIYVSMRESLNAFIRFNHAFTLPRMLFSRLVLKEHRISANPGFFRHQDIIENINRLADPGLRRELQDIIVTTELSAALTVLARSPLLWLLIAGAAPLLAIVLMLVDLKQAIRSIVRPFIDAIESEMVNLELASIQPQRKTSFLLFGQ